MPSVVMKRSMRIFGSRVLRSGRINCPAHSQQDNNLKISAATEPQSWIYLLQHQNSGGCPGPDLVTPMDIDNRIVPSRSDQKLSIRGGGDRFVLIYHRKRKRSDVNDVMFGKKYFRKRCRYHKRNTKGSSFSLIAETEDGDRHGWLSSFMLSVFKYVCKNGDLKVSRLSSLMITKPFSIVFSSHGIDFSWVPSWVTRKDACKIHGSKGFTPLFTLEFSALPSCFMYLHSGLLLNRSLTINDAPNLTLVDVDPSLNTVLDELTVELPVDVELPVKKLNRNNTRKRKEFVKPVVVDNSQSRRSIPKQKDMTLSWGEDNDPNRCRANIIFFQPGGYLNVNDVVIMLEMSSLRKWSLTVSKNRLLKLNFHPLKTMNSCCTKRDANIVTWRDNRYGWRLEFVNRQQWFKFKELYSVCSDRNSLSSTDGTVNVPIFREIENYDDDYEKNVGVVVPFMRSESYIRDRDDELTRMLKKNTAIYEMDSDDEKWLGEYNGEVSMEDFELIIDASEDNIVNYPGDQDASNLYVELENKDFVEAAFSYWSKKRERRSSSLCKIYKNQQKRRDRLRIKRVVRKKRTPMLRKRRQPETGKFFWKCIGKDRKVLEEEKKVLQKYEADKARASILVESAIEKRKLAQMLMVNADLATLKALEAVRIAEAAKFSESVARPSTD